MKPNAKIKGVVLYGEEFASREEVDNVAEILQFSLCSAELRETLTDVVRVGLRDGQWIVHLPNSGSISEIDFSSTRIKRRIQPNNLYGEYLVRAVLGRKKQRELNVWDLTAGMGVDGFLLAAAGCQVTMFERIPMLTILLQHAITAASNGESESIRQATSRLKLYRGDSVDWLKWLLRFSRDGDSNSEEAPCFGPELKQPQGEAKGLLPSVDSVAALTTCFPPDIIYLDPMFHVGLDSGVSQQQPRAAVKKSAALLQSLSAASLNDVANNEQLLRLALQSAKQKVVVKRAHKSEYLGSIKPASSIQGKAVRFDIYPVV